MSQCLVLMMVTEGSGLPKTPTCFEMLFKAFHEAFFVDAMTGILRIVSI